MKTTSGFVAVKEDGTFLQMGLQTRWGNESAWVSEVKDIEQATVFAAPTERAVIGRHRLDYPHPFRFVPVEIRREVVLTGWGVR